jgi:hypothetical protein
MEEVSNRLQNLQLLEEETKWLQAPLGHAVYYEDDAAVDILTTAKPSEAETLVESRKRKPVKKPANAKGLVTPAAQGKKSSTEGVARIRKLFSKKSSGI